MYLSFMAAVIKVVMISAVFITLQEVLLVCCEADVCTFCTVDRL